MFSYGTNGYSACIRACNKWNTLQKQSTGVYCGNEELFALTSEDTVFITTSGARARATGYKVQRHCIRIWGVRRNVYVAAQLWAQPVVDALYHQYVELMRRGTMPKVAIQPMHTVA